MRSVLHSCFGNDMKHQQTDKRLIFNKLEMHEAFDALFYTAYVSDIKMLITYAFQVRVVKIIVDEEQNWNLRSK